MKKSFLVFMIIFVFCLLACTGQNTAENAKNKKGTKTVVSKDIRTGVEKNVDSDRKLYKELDKNLFVDAKIIFPNKNSYTKYKSKYKIYSIDELSWIFLKENSSKTNVIKNKERSHVFTLTAKSGAEICSNINFFSFTSQPGRDDEIAELMEEYVSSEMKETFMTQELAFLTRKEAIQQGLDLLKKLNIACLSDAKVDVIAMKKDQLENLQGKMLNEEAYKKWVKLGKTKIIKDWSSNDNYYLLKFTFGQDSLPVYNTEQEPSQRMAEDWAPPSMNVQILLSSKGIIYASGQGLLSVLDMKSQIKPKQILSVDEALNKLKKKYDEVILTDKNTVSKIWLEYVPICGSVNLDNCILSPYWCFQIEIMAEHSGIKKEISNVERFNAFSGGDLTYGK